jgi:hypothetical protein
MPARPLHTSVWQVVLKLADATGTPFLMGIERRLYFQTLEMAESHLLVTSKIETLHNAAKRFQH